MSDLNDLEPVNRAKLQPLAAADWLPSGPVLRGFILSPDPVTCIMGPLGSGKTTGGFIKGLICSAVVPRSPVDGVRYARGLVVRDTYRNLETNTIPSWFENFPADLGSFKGGGGGEPGKAVIDFDLGAGEILHMEVLFAALGDHNVKSFCDGFQANWAFANGLDVLPRELISFMWPRLGRWPPPKHRSADWRAHVHRWRKFFGDMNAPDLDNWTYGDLKKKKPGFVEGRPKGWNFFPQPGGEDADAENRDNLPTDYYESLKTGAEAWWINRFVHNKFGFSRAGTPVYPEWNDALHVARQPLKYDRDLPLHVGLDAGRDPRAVAIQRNRGRVFGLGELVPDERMGAKRFGHVLSEWLAEKFPDAKVHGHCDPSAAYPTQDSDDDEVWMDIVKRVAKIPIKPAPSNALTVRLESVRDLLTDLVDGEPAFLLSPDCMVLRRGFNSGYRFGKTRVHGDEIDTGEPVKNDYSHPHDAFQYAALGSSDYRELRGREKRSRESRRPDETAWNPHGG